MCRHWLLSSCVYRIGAILPTPVLPTPILPTYYLLGAILPTHAKCDQNNVKQLKQAVRVYKVKGIVQKRNKK